MSDRVAKAFEEFLRTRRDHRDGLTARQQLWTAFEAGAQFTLDEIRERTGLTAPTQEMLPIPDFLRNQENLRAERAAQETCACTPGDAFECCKAKPGSGCICDCHETETRSEHTAAHDCACEDCVKAETRVECKHERTGYGGDDLSGGSSNMCLDCGKQV